MTTNSLRVIAAAEAGDDNTAQTSPSAPPRSPAPKSGGGAASGHHRLNQAAIDAAMAAPAGERTSKLFKHIVMVGRPEAA